MKDLLATNMSTLEREFAWFSEVLDLRFKLYFNQEGHPLAIHDLHPPDLNSDDSRYAMFVKEHQLQFRERVALVLAITPHVKPHLLDIFFIKNANYNRGYTEFGGYTGSHHGGFLPTGETLNFILGGGDLEERARIFNLLSSDSVLIYTGLLAIQGVQKGEPQLSGPLTISTEFLVNFTTGKTERPDIGADFPAKYIDTPLDWDDLVLDRTIMEEIAEIKTWIEHGPELLEEWGLSRKVKPGYRCLFYGPPGTGKTLCATLLGKATGRDVYRIDLSMVVSKYIGETEKNLENVFRQAENKKWILFFDEADALFGKRTATNSSNDRFANQEVAYLLQRVESYPGTVILASNLKSNIDEAFARRFQAMIHFPMPKPNERLKLWTNAFHGTVSLQQDCDLPQLAKQYEISGGAIINVLRYCAVQARRGGRREVGRQLILEGIRREFKKEDKTL